MKKENITKVQLPIRYDQQFIDELINSGIKLPNSLQGAVIKRQSEFLAGRRCSVDAMLQLGVSAPVQPGIGIFREPLWPKGITGSISHDKTHAVAVVSLNMPSGIGVDLEHWFSLSTAKEIAPQVITASEWLFQCEFSSLSHFLTVVFSAKESLFKAMFSRIKRYVDFSVAHVTDYNPVEGNITLTLTEKLADTLPCGMEIIVNISYREHGVETLVVLG